MDLINHLLPIFSQLGAWSYWLALLISFLESLALVGEIVPGATLIAFAGFLAARGILDIGDLFIFATIGAILGDGLSFYLGTKGTHLFKDENKFLKTAHLEYGKRFFKKHGGKSVFIGRFIGTLRPIIPFVAGVAKMDSKKFIIWNVISAILWAIFYLGIGYFFNNALEIIKKWVVRIDYAVVILLGLFLLFHLVKVIIVRRAEK